jgi:hypothetical protein
MEITDVEITLIGIIATTVALLGIALCLGVIVMTFMQSRRNNEAIRHVEERVETIDPAKALATAEAVAVAQRLAEKNKPKNDNEKEQP